VQVWPNQQQIVPEDLAGAIAADAGAQSFWDSISYSRRRRIVLAATTFAILAGRTSAVRVRVNAPGQRLLRRGRSLAATATVRGAGNVSGLTVLPVTVRLERR